MQRLYYFDNIKIVLILVVIFIHAGLAYITNAEGWSPSFPGPPPRRSARRRHVRSGSCLVCDGTLLFHLGVPPRRLVRP